MRFLKSTKAVLDYTINWEDYLQGEDIQSSTWSIMDDVSSEDNPLVIEEEQMEPKKALVIVSGGEPKNEYTLENIIQYVVDGKTLTDKRHIILRINE